MHLGVILRVSSVLLLFFSFTLLVPSAIAFFSDDGTFQGFLLSFLIAFLTGLALRVITLKETREIRSRDSFLVIILLWTLLGLFGALPLKLISLNDYVAEQPNLSFVDSVFESVSGLTTTGATVIKHLDNLPKSILFYRQQLQWIGGIGIIVLAVAILPMLGMGGMQLYQAEVPGPVKENRLTPRITETAKALSLVYFGITVACAVAYYFAGMDFFDAICHSFSTVAIGGFSTHDQSIGYFQNSSVELVAIFFMFIAGVNFALHFSGWHNRNIQHYWSDPEFRTYTAIITLAVVISFLCLIFTSKYDYSESLIRSLFEVVSTATTTGFTIGGYSDWPTFLPFLIFFTAFIGGCAGSTGGGIKVFRVVLVIKQGFREIQRLIHPNAVFPIKIGRRPVLDKELEAVWAFYSVYIFVFIVAFLVLMATGLDVVTAFSAVGACINNLGPGLGAVVQHYAEINDFAKAFLSLIMLLGRLEIFPLLVVLNPMFWRR